MPGFGWPGDPFFRWFFGEEPDERGLQRRFRTPPQQGIGSGVIVSKDGYILSNHHVVQGADRVKVALHDGREYNASVVGTDEKSDVAVLKIDANDLPAIAMADSDQIEVGDIVLAIGNPFGVGQTVTMGMVSAKDRGGLVGLEYEDFIQTDAAINPGNSGGALVDAQGRLIGINTLIISRSGGSQGIGFAIPTNLARQVMEQLIEFGKVTRGYLGIWMQDVTPALAKEFKLDTDKGVVVTEVVPNGPADKAGIRTGDVLVEFAGKPVVNGRKLKFEVARIRPGTQVPAKVLRDGKERTLEVTLAELPGSEQLASGRPGAPEDTGTLNGVTVADLDSRTRRQYDIPRDVEGALVTDVNPNSASYEAGLRPGDVILEINRRRVRSADEAVRLTEHPADKTTLLRIWSRGGVRFLVVDESDGG
jgi:serine protease Do